MSSLAAARADNFYHPPDWDPSKESRNKFHGSHGALGDRARKLHEGILIIRFEMPFNVWCEGCGHLIGKGVRFNAEKKQVGKYHTTKIWSFSMKAPCCQQHIEVQTDPRNAQYVVVSGGRCKVETGGEDDGRVELDPRAGDRPVDALGRLEATEEDKRRASDDISAILSLQEESASRYGDDATNNRQLRRAMRVARLEESARDARRRELGLPEHLKLAPETRLDRLRAASVDFGAGGSLRMHKNWKRDRKRIASSNIFSSSAVAATKKIKKKTC